MKLKKKVENEKYRLIDLTLLPILLTILYTPLLGQHMDSTVQGNSRFAFNIYKKLNQEKPGGNLFLSPFSISAALAMTYAGAKNETQQAMLHTMHFGKDPDSLHAHFSLLLKKLKLNQNGVQLSIVNSLFAQKDYHFREAYFEFIKSKYDAGLEYVNFKENSEREKARLQINEWVENKTNDKIKEILTPPMLDETSRLVLVNAIYFLGKWGIEFNKKLTKESTFYPLSKGSIKTPFMNIKTTLKYHETEKLQAVEIPYKENKLSMIIILPKGKNGIKELSNTINVDTYMNIINSLKVETVELSVPKFKTTAEFNLEKQLSDMGMSVAFTDKADFSGMTGTKELKIDKVVHKAFIEISEEGTEASAATAVVMQRGTAPKKNKIVKADHAFLFLIKDNETESILFIGNMLNPMIN